MKQTLPPGYSLIVTHDARGTVTRLRHGRKEVGTVTLYVQRLVCARHLVEVYETHSYLDSAEWNKGLGLAMYSSAIDHGLSKGRNVVSSQSPSIYAQRVWQSTRLAEAYVVNRFNKRWWVSRART